MSSEVLFYITKYGYYGIFILVFLQEVGAPNPIPNELVLLFSGFLCFKGVLYLPFVILSAFIADFTGTSILHTVFYFFGNFLLDHKPKWLPVPVKAIRKLSDRLSKKGLLGIYIGRLSPFIRGYTSVISGLLQIRYKVFLPIAIITAIVWGSAYTIIGMLLGTLCVEFLTSNGHFTLVMLSLLGTLILVIFLNRYIHLVREKRIKNV